MAKRKKKIKYFSQEHFCWIITIFFALVSFGLIWSANRGLNRESLSITAYQAGSKEAWLEFDFGNGKKRMFVGSFENPIPLSMVLSANSREIGLSYKTKGDKIERIDGKIGNWAIYRNNQIIKSPFSKLTVRGGDKYVLRLQK